MTKHDRTHKNCVESGRLTITKGGKRHLLLGITILVHTVVSATTAADSEPKEKKFNPNFQWPNLAEYVVLVCVPKHHHVGQN